MLILVSLNASPFQNKTHPVRFRAIPASLSLQTGFLEGSESCLIHADMRSNLPSLSNSSSSQIYVNPLVRVSYTKSAYNAQNSVFQVFIEKIVGPIVALVYDLGDWWFQCRLARYAADRREKIQQWERRTGLEEVGEHCLIDNLQLLTPWGWEHVKYE
jgi:hypothetical protein